jgi:putative acetyltransferase
LIAFFSYREDGELLAVGALKQLAPGHGEIKSMHTAQTARGRGIGRAMLGHLIGLARERGCHRVSLETGAIPAFAPARALYASAGFVPCGPLDEYAESPFNTFMTLTLQRDQGVSRRSSAARIGAQTTAGGVVVVANSSTIHSSSA